MFSLEFLIYKPCNNFHYYYLHILQIIQIFLFYICLIADECFIFSSLLSLLICNISSSKYLHTFTFLNSLIYFSGLLM